MIADHGLRWVVGAPFEDTIGLLHFMTAGVLKRHPGIKVLVAHLGGPLPFLAQRIDDNRPYWQQGFSEPSEAWKKMWWDAANFHVYLRARTPIEDAGLPTEQVDHILEHNACAPSGALTESRKLPANTAGIVHQRFRIPFFAPRATTWPAGRIPC
ncbi:hypothetical protein [Amycolatopsis sp. lyj-109]|uniref:hypothetical protein n=1 Tax=Amycolatopsis sp. lyj-109 TaxID=2789287 RepID=UPI00397E1E41